MKQILSILLLTGTLAATAQEGSPATPYYNGMNWSQVGNTLKNDLSARTISKHTRNVTYAELWEALPLTDRSAHNAGLITLFYGWENGTDSDVTNDLYRDADNHGGSNGQWNREHVYLQSIVGQSGAGSDVHHLRPTDVQRNNQRGSHPFAASAEPSIPSFKSDDNTWFPGDNWKGDVARILMYLYIRYPQTCLPINMVQADAIASDPNMPLLLLQWNAEDPVSPIEDQRNTVMNSSNYYAQGNRNPFIDNPYLATLIWGGPVAQNRWPFLNTNEFAWESTVTVYPIPTYNRPLNISTTTEIDKISVYNPAGQLIYEINQPANETQIDHLPNGFYLVKVEKGANSTVKKVIVN